MFDPFDLPAPQKLSYYIGKYDGIDAAEFLLRHIYPTDTQEQKEFLHEVAEELHKRKLVAREDYEAARRLFVKSAA